MFSYAFPTTKAGYELSSIRTLPYRAHYKISASKQGDILRKFLYSSYTAENDHGKCVGARILLHTLS